MKFTDQPTLRSGRATVFAALALATVGIAAGVAPGTARAGEIAGSVAFFSDRVCAQPSGTTCNLNSSKKTVVKGGFGSQVDASVDWHSIDNLEVANGAGRALFGSGTVLPTVGARSQSGDASRVGATVTAFRSYTNGATALDISWTASLDYQITQDGPQLDGYHDGTVNVAFGILRMSDFAGYGPGMSALTIIGDIDNTFPDCGAGAIAAGGYDSAGQHGIVNSTMSLTTACGGGRIRINPGEQYVMVATIQAISNRNGFANALHTFKFDYDPENTFYAGTDDLVSADVFSSIHSEIPEPATWALLIGGFGGVGGALRRRRTAVSPLQA